MVRFLLLLLITIFPALAGETRLWTSSDGSKEFKAKFVERVGDAITILREDGKEFTIDISRLHKKDQKWLHENHSGTTRTISNPSHVFDTLAFGDSRGTVAAKLKESKILETKVEGIFLGRTGLNGIYRTKAQLGGLYCYLYFDWDENGGLREISLHTENQPLSEYDQSLEDCWAELINIVQTIHGKPIQSGKMVNPTSLQDSQILGSHLWKIRRGGSILLGTSKANDQFQVILRFTASDLKSQ